MRSKNPFLSTYVRTYVRTYRLPCHRTPRCSWASTISYFASNGKWLRVTLLLLGRTLAHHNTLRQKKIDGWPPSRRHSIPHHGRLPARGHHADDGRTKCRRQWLGRFLARACANLTLLSLGAHVVRIVFVIVWSMVRIYVRLYVRMHWYVRLPMPNAKKDAVYSFCTSNPRQHKRGGRGILAKHSCSAIRAVAPRRARGQANALTSRTLRRVGVLHDRHHLHPEW